jgi:hypothetical protein
VLHVTSRRALIASHRCVGHHRVFGGADFLVLLVSVQSGETVILQVHDVGAYSDHEVDLEQAGGIFRYIEVLINDNLLPMCIQFNFPQTT